MNFDFSEEQGMLRDSVARFVQDDYDFDTRRAIADSEQGMSAEKWQTFGCRYRLPKSTAVLAVARSTSWS